MFDAALCPRVIDEGQEEEACVSAHFQEELEHFNAFFTETHFHDVRVGFKFALSHEEVLKESLGDALKDVEDPAQDGGHPCEEGADDTDDRQKTEEAQKKGGGADDLDAEPGGSPHAVIECSKIGVADEVVPDFVGDGRGDDPGRCPADEAGCDGDVPRTVGPGVGRAFFDNGEVVFFSDFFCRYAAFF